MALDLRDPASCAGFFSAVRERFDGIDLLFVSAGAAPLRRFAATSDDDWRTAMETNVIGVHRTIAGLIDLLGPGSIAVVVSSESVDQPRSHLGAYGASKAALEHSLEPVARKSTRGYGSRSYRSGPPCRPSSAASSTRTSWSMR